MPPKKLALAAKFDFLIKWTEAEKQISISEQDIADKIGMSYRSIHALRNGEKDNPQLSTLQALCEYFDIGLSYFDCDTIEGCRKYLEGQREERALAEIARRAEGLSPEGLKNILNMIDIVRRAEGRSE